MLYSDNIRKAMLLAYSKHHNQLDKGGYPYIAHLLYLAESMDDEESTIVALLHDILEDTDCTLKELQQHNFSQDIYTAIEFLTHQRNINYIQYIENLKLNKLACKVKIVDLKHNLNYTRIDNISIKREERKNKYTKALLILEKEL